MRINQEIISNNFHVILVVFKNFSIFFVSNLSKVHFVPSNCFTSPVTNTVRISFNFGLKIFTNFQMSNSNFH